MEICEKYVIRLKCIKWNMDFLIYQLTLEIDQSTKFKSNIKKYISISKISFDCEINGLILTQN